MLLAGIIFPWQGVELSMTEYGLIIRLNDTWLMTYIINAIFFFCFVFPLSLQEKQISNEEDHLRKMSEARLQFKDQLRQLEMEQQSILSMIGSEIDAACEIFSRDSMEKFKVILSFKYAAGFVVFLMNFCSGTCMHCFHRCIDNHSNRIMAI